MVTLSETLTICREDELVIVTAMPTASTAANNSVSYGPAGRQLLLAAIQYAKRNLSNPVLIQAFGGTLHERVFEAMCRLIPELPWDVHYKILQTYVDWQQNAAQLAASPEPPIRDTHDVAESALPDAQRLRDRLLELPVQAQKHIMAHFWAMARGHRVIGETHPMSKQLLKLTEKEIFDIAVALNTQHKASTNPAA